MPPKAASGTGEDETQPVPEQEGQREMAEDPRLSQASTQTQMRTRLRELGEPIWGAKDVLWTRLSKAERQSRKHAEAALARRGQAPKAAPATPAAKRPRLAVADAPQEHTLGAVVARALAAAREAVVAAEIVATVWTAPAPAADQLPEAARRLLDRLGEASSQARVLSEQLGNATFLAQLLQDSLGGGVSDGAEPARGSFQPARRPPTPPVEPAPALLALGDAISSTSSPGGPPPPSPVASELPREVVPASLHPGDESWNNCWALLVAEGWSKSSGTGHSDRKIYFCPPGVEVGQPGKRRRIDFFDSRRQVLISLRDSGSLAAETRSLVEQALKVEDEKYNRMPHRRALLAAGKIAEVDTNEKGEVANPKQAAANSTRGRPGRPAACGPRLPPRLPQEGCGLAEWRAKELLSHVARSGRKIVDKDVLRVLDVWKFKPNTKRRNVMRAGVESVSSEMLGLIRVRVYNKFVVAHKSTKFPHVTRLLSEYFRDHPPAGQAPGTFFPFTTVCVNKNYAARRHRDVNNVGLTVIRALGDFSGGKVRYWPNDSGKGDVDGLDEADSVQLNVHGRTVAMKSTLAHEVEAFKGTRYSLVWFSITGYERASADVRKNLADQCGIELVPFAQAGRQWPKPAA